MIEALVALPTEGDLTDAFGEDCYQPLPPRTGWVCSLRERLLTFEKVTVGVQGTSFFNQLNG
jgi:hypothetical protein